MSGYRVVMSENHLEHNGILGMKWGKRNGPPYPLSAADHSKSEINAGYKKSLNGNTNEHLYGIKKKSSKNDTKEKNTKFHDEQVSKIEKRYKKDLQLSDSEAKKLAEERYQKMKKIAIATGVTVGAVALTATAMYIGKNYINYTIKKDMTLQTISSDKGRMEAGTHFFTTFLENDKHTYQGMFGGDTDFTLLNKVTDDMRIASTHSANKVFKKDILRNKNLTEQIKSKIPDIDLNSRDAREAINDALHGKKSIAIDPTRRQIMSNAELFNYTMPLEANKRKSETYQKTRKAINEIYIDGLTKRGFDGIRDINDSNYSGLRAYKPTIITNKSKLGQTDVRIPRGTKVENGKIAVYDTQKHKEYYNKMREEGQLNIMKKVLSDEFSKPLITTGNATIAGLLGFGALADSDETKRYLNSVPKENRQKAYNIKYRSGMTPAKMAKEAGIPLAVAQVIYYE